MPKQELKRPSKNEPIIGEWYLYDSDVYKVILTSRGKDMVLLKRLSDGHHTEVAFSTFKYGFSRVFKIGAVAKLLNRSPRSIYRYEKAEQIKKAERYRDAWGRKLRFYTKADIVEMRDMISDIHAGRPRRDNLIVNNSLPSKAELLMTIRERFGD